MKINKFLGLTAISTLILATGCIVPEGEGHGHGHARYERHEEVIVGPPVVVVRPPEVIIR